MFLLLLYRIVKVALQSVLAEFCGKGQDQQQQSLQSRKGGCTGRVLWLALNPDNGRCEPRRFGGLRCAAAVWGVTPKRSESTSVGGFGCCCCWSSRSHTHTNVSQIAECFASAGVFAFFFSLCFGGDSQWLQCCCGASRTSGKKKNELLLWLFGNRFGSFQNVPWLGLLQKQLGLRGRFSHFSRSEIFSQIQNQKKMWHSAGLTKKSASSFPIRKCPLCK